MTEEERAEAGLKVKRNSPDLLALRLFEDGMYAGVRPLMFHYTIIFGHVDDDFGYDDRWCYTDNFVAVLMALENWRYPEQREPEGWQRNPRTSRRRPDGDPTKEYIEP